MSDPDIAAMGTPPLRLPDLRTPRPPARSPAQDAPARPETPPAPPPAAVEDDPPWKYTALLTTADRDLALDLEASVVALARVRRNKGMRAEVLRAFLALAHRDPQLQQRLADQLAEQLGDGPTA